MDSYSCFLDNVSSPLEDMIVPYLPDLDVNYAILGVRPFSSTMEM